MYGMIHRGVRDMVIEHSGPDAWHEIEVSAGFGPEHLITGQTYDDSIAQTMLGLAAERMGLSIAECLTAFGRYWVRFAERGAFGNLMKFAGRDFVTFVGNLDRMHQAVVSAMPDARVPSFRITDQADGMLRVWYASERTGLEPMVVGLLEGLLARFELKGDVEEARGANDEVEFVVRFEPR